MSKNDMTYSCNNEFGGFLGLLTGLNEQFVILSQTQILFWLLNPFNDAINLDQYLQSFSSQYNMPMTTPKITAAVDLVYNNSGILQNAHSEYNITTSINGTSVDFNPQFDISGGTHTSIDADWNPPANTTSSIPGYSIWLIGLASLSGMTVVVLSIKKKKL